MSRVPIPIYAVIRGDRVLVVGHPGSYDWLPEDDPQQHNCDAMGCSSLEHVIARVPLDTARETGDWLARFPLETRDEHG